MKKVQRLRFWGTGAGEVTPAPFCRCPVCEYARAHGGKDVRLRSGFRLDEKVMLDLGEDFLAQSAKLLEDPFDVQHVLFSHVHSDHFSRIALTFSRFIPKFRSKKMEDIPEPPGPLHLYLTRDGLRILDDICKGNEAWLKPELVDFHALDFYETYDIAGYKVTPLKGNHTSDYEAYSGNYLFEFPNGKKLYYALDSGQYIEETYEYLKNVKLDMLIGECTYPREEESGGGHMTLVDKTITLDRLYAQGTIDENTHIYASHIAGLHKTHDELCAYFAALDKPYKVTVAYDGLCVEEESGMFEGM